MSGGSKAPLFSARERRTLLWLCSSAVCWRWLLAMRTPLAGHDAVVDLAVARELAAGNLSALTDTFLGPWWAVLLAPIVACGAEPLLAAQVLGCVLGGLVLVPVAIAAQRLREGAGLPAALLSFALPAVTVGAAAGDEVALDTAMVAVAVLCFTRGRLVSAGLLAVLVFADTWELATFRGALAAWSLAAPLAIAVLLPPRPRRIAVLLLVPIALFALTSERMQCLPPWSSLVTVLAGVALARLPRRSCGLVLAATVGLGLWDGWHAIEPAETRVEAHVGRFVRSRLPAPEWLWSGYRRVWYYAGRSRCGLPAGNHKAYVFDENRLADRDWWPPIRHEFDRLELPPDLEVAARARGIVVFLRRE